jgi:hypothetical protein
VSVGGKTEFCRYRSSLPAFCEHGNELSDAIKCGTFLDQIELSLSRVLEDNECFLFEICYNSCL